MKLLNIIFESVVDMYEVTPIKWTEDAIRREAIKYNSKVEFVNGNKSAYNAARKLGILDDLGFVNKYKSWDEDAIRREAIKYNSKNKFEKGSGGAYDAAIRLGILDDLGFVGKKYKSWNKDEVRREAIKYNSKTELQKGNTSAYNWARKLGILDDLGFKVLGNHYKRMIYAFIFKENNAVYVGLTYNSDKRHKQHLKIDTNGGKTSPVKLFMDKTGETPEMIKLTDYLPKEEAIVKEKEYEKYYRNLGYNILNIAKTGGLGGNISKWTEDAIRREAINYNTKSKFAKGNGSAYVAALRLGLLDDLGFVGKKYKSWDEDAIRREVKNKNYNTKSEFQKGSGGAYEAAWRLGLLNMLFPKK